jgi:hypothetical protein
MAAPAAWAAVDYTKLVPEAEGLTAYQKDGSIQIRLDNLPLLTYRASASLKYPYFSTLNGPVSGLSLIAESAEPYPHHRGLFLARLRSSERRQLLGRQRPGIWTDSIK